MTVRQLAAQYVADQISIMKKHGAAPVLDAERRREVIAEVARTFETMREASEQAVKPARKPVLARAR
jgi:hypothetical protein